MKKYDVSIHFQTKNQTLEDLNRKLDEWFDSDKYQGQFDFSERCREYDGNNLGFSEPRTVLHHCFLPKKVLKEKGISLMAYDFIENIAEDDVVCWNGVTANWGDETISSLHFDRVLMLENIKKLNGAAMFIGDIVGGVKEEYDIAVGLGIDIIIVK